MKVYVLAQFYHEELFAYAALKWITPLADKIILTEGCLTPFGDQTPRSTDRTISEIERAIKDFGDDKIIFSEVHRANCRDAREAFEGVNKNGMLQTAIDHGLKDGDVIYILDADEFYMPEAWLRIKKMFVEDPKLNHVRSEEYQFAYSLKYQCLASHARWYRYRKGARFGETNHFKYDGKREYAADIITNRKEFPFFHLCWVKPPEIIAKKIESFKRMSFSLWFKNVYLTYLWSASVAYKNNRSIPPYYGTGFLEGQHNKLEYFTGDLPPALKEIAHNLDFEEDTYNFAWTLR